MTRETISTNKQFKPHHHIDQATMYQLLQAARKAKDAKEETKKAAKEVQVTYPNVRPPRGTFAGIAPSGGVIMSGGMTKLGILEGPLQTCLS